MTGKDKQKATATEMPLHILAVVGSLGRQSSTRLVVHEMARLLTARHCRVDVLDFRKEPLPLYNPDTAHESPLFPRCNAAWSGRTSWSSAPPITTAASAAR